jgi:hypothetical protein
VIDFKWINFIAVTWDLVDNNNITLSIVWFTAQRKVFNLKMAHERAKTCHWDKLCKNIVVIYTLNKLCLTVLYPYFVILYNRTGMAHLKASLDVTVKRRVDDFGLLGCDAASFVIGSWPFEGFVMCQEALRSFQMSGTIYLVTQYYIPVDRNLEMHYCGSLKTQKRKMFCPCQELNPGSSNLQHIQSVYWLSYSSSWCCSL